MDPKELTPDSIIRLPEVMRHTGLGRSTIYRMIDASTFPTPIHLTPRSVGWRWADIVDWNRGRKQAA